MPPVEEPASGNHDRRDYRIGWPGWVEINRK